jgi:ribonuclease M5
MAEKTGVIILTDSDGAGFVIRNYLKGAVSSDGLKHAYIPDVRGKEKRKSSPSKSGRLGVEGMSAKTLTDALLRAGATVDDSAPGVPLARITKADLYAAGIAGRENSAQKRAELLKRMDLPSLLSPNALVDVLNALTTREEFMEMVL